MARALASKDLVIPFYSRTALLVSPYAWEIDCVHLNLHYSSLANQSINICGVTSMCRTLFTLQFGK